VLHFFLSASAIQTIDDQSGHEIGTELRIHS